MQLLRKQQYTLDGDGEGCHLFMPARQKEKACAIRTHL
jgi:hypothetical protein